MIGPRASAETPNSRYHERTLSETTVRAIRCADRRVVLDQSADDPTPAPGEAVVRPVRLAIGPADLRAVRDNFAGVLGREFVGVVEHADDQTWVGKRVVGSPLVPCRTCDLCTRGLSRHCPNRAELGSRDRDGCFADRFTIPLDNLVEIPVGVDDDAAVFAVPLAAALHAQQLVRVEGKTYISILGDNTSGLLAVQTLSRLNASVRLLGTRPERMELCAKWGIKHRHRDDVGRRADQDVIVVASDDPTDFELATRMVRPRGTIIMLSAPSERVPVHAIVEHELELLGARAGNLDEALLTIAAAGVDVLPLISKRTRLADAPEAFDAAANGAIKVLLEP
jgi:threonine dehydrogenase-like Zn-dependent dehydrogenase